MSRYKLGLDIGSTTIKLALLDGAELIYSQYTRHFSDIHGELARMFEALRSNYRGVMAHASITGSGGLNVAKSLGLPFVQEVIAGTQAVLQYAPDADIIIELGGEDAKITYLKPSLEQRMNGTCAGGTGAFIDQMASLLQTDASGLNELAAMHTTLYPIASRCGVFAKSDMQPLFNEGASPKDLSASVLQAVVTQTIAGLAQGRPLRGNIVFLGGPLHFLPELRKRFVETLGDSNTYFTPENAELFVAIGAASLASSQEVDIGRLGARLASCSAAAAEIERIRPLF